MLTKPIGDMRFFALATDYDGTLAEAGVVNAVTVRALDRLTASGRTAVLVTGRCIEDLQRVCPELDRFERIVAENGAVVYTPATRELRVLDEAPPRAFVEELRARGVEPLDVCRVVVATREPHEKTVLDAIRALGLELHLEFNKGAVMVLPSGVTKRTGLAAALEEMRLSPHNVVGVGDAENDHAFLASCECAVGVANALQSLKERCDWVTAAPRGHGVVQLIDALLDDDLASLAGPLARHRLVLGRGPDGSDVTIEPYGESVLLTGPSGSGKTTIAAAIVERIVDRGYQIALVDPEGDHEQHEALAVVGSAEHAPAVDEVARLLEEPRRSVVAALLAVPLADRPRWFAALLARVQELRSHTGRPHWLVVDEAHHVLPASWDPATLGLPPRIGEMLLMTVDPTTVRRAALEAIDVVLATAQRAAESLAAFARATGRAPPEMPASPDSAVLWRVRERRAVAVDVAPARQQHLRHKRKYARGELAEERSFWFRGPKGALNLRAQNLQLFGQIAEGVDDATWMHHLRAGDYSRWFREAIKDGELADEASAVEHEREISAAESRRRIREAIARRYTLPA